VAAGGSGRHPRCADDGRDCRAAASAPDRPGRRLPASCDDLERGARRKRNRHQRPGYVPAGSVGNAKCTRSGGTRPRRQAVHGVGRPALESLKCQRPGLTTISMDPRKGIAFGQRGTASEPGIRAVESSPRRNEPLVPVSPHLVGMNSRSHFPARFTLCSLFGIPNRRSASVAI